MCAALVLLCGCHWTWSKMIDTKLDSEAFFASVRFNADGLVPAIVQDARTQQVLMMAWMNTESLALHDGNG